MKFKTRCFFFNSYSAWCCCQGFILLDFSVEQKIIIFVLLPQYFVKYVVHVTEWCKTIRWKLFEVIYSIDLHNDEGATKMSALLLTLSLLGFTLTLQKKKTTVLISYLKLKYILYYEEFLQWHLKQNWQHTIASICLEISWFV